MERPAIANQAGAVDSKPGARSKARCVAVWAGRLVVPAPCSSGKAQPTAMSPGVSRSAGAVLVRQQHGPYAAVTAQLITVGQADAAVGESAVALSMAGSN